MQYVIKSMLFNNTLQHYVTNTMVDIMTSIKECTGWFFGIFRRVQVSYPEICDDSDNEVCFDELLGITREDSMKKNTKSLVI